MKMKVEKKEEIAVTRMQKRIKQNKEKQNVVKRGRYKENKVKRGRNKSKVNVAKKRG